ncbi:LysE/ArgO family amino acid transporter [Agarivorans gilvus]|nr:LysE/ArgO family amino acid transporter [Agarivorans gilvus]
MFSSYFTGLSLMASLIMPIGMQNAFVLNQGIRRRHHLLVASFCSMADVFFMSLGVWGGAQLFSTYPWLLYSISVLGSGFMLVYGYQCLQRAWQGKSQFARGEAKHELKAIILACCAFTFLNPHVYIDTIVILGGFAANISTEHRPMFVAGGISASFLWFFSLALLGAKLAPWLARPRAQQVIDGVIGLMMFGLAGYLLKFVFG